MRSGPLYFPPVLVQPVSQNQDGLTCETYVENAAEAVNVLPVKSSNTVLVPVQEQWPANMEGMVHS